MSTPFIKIYKNFLSNIKDLKLVNKLSPEELEEVLYGYMEKACSIRFKRCKKNLFNRNLELKEFDETLNSEEITILSKCMVLEWLTPYINNEKHLKERITTKDYKMFSPANHIKMLNELYNNINNEIKYLERSYWYNNFKGYKK